MVFLWTILSALIVSIISLIGIFTLTIREDLLRRLVFYFVGFSAGALIGGTFLHILPEVLKKTDTEATFYYIIAGIVIFFLLERYFYWRHCHDGVCEVHAFTYLSLIGDGLHNFIDGMVIAASFSVSFHLGLVTTLAIILHEIPQEMGDFGLLVYGGFSKQKALFFNFISALTCVAGALLGYFISGMASGFSNIILPLTGGGFIYIASSDLIPQIHKESNLRRSTLAFIAFLAGIIIMATAKLLLPE